MTTADEGVKRDVDLFVIPSGGLPRRQGAFGSTRVMIILPDRPPIRLSARPLCSGITGSGTVENGRLRAILKRQQPMHGSCTAASVATRSSADNQARTLQSPTPAAASRRPMRGRPAAGQCTRCGMSLGRGRRRRRDVRWRWQPGTRRLMPPARRRTRRPGRLRLRRANRSARPGSPPGHRLSAISGRTVLSHTVQERLNRRQTGASRKGT
jgi:hypothetical protein